jgi:hypothetical protein
MYNHCLNLVFFLRKEKRIYGGVFLSASVGLIKFFKEASVAKTCINLKCPMASAESQSQLYK